MLLLKFQKGVQSERSQAPKSGNDMSYVVAEHDGVLRTKLREHAVAQDGHSCFCQGEGADAAIAPVDDVECA